MPEWYMIVLYVFIAWFVIDMASRIYLMHAPGEDYKEDQTDSEMPNAYKQEKEAEAAEILSRYRIGRWILNGRR